MSTGSQKSETKPWKPHGIQLKKLYAEANALYDQGPLQYFPGQTLADRHPFSSQATQNISDLVGNFNIDSLGSALDQNQRTLSGEYLSPFTNPNLRATGDAAAEDITRSYSRTVAPQIASRFAGSGRSMGPNTGMNAEGAAMSAGRRDLGQELSQMYSGLYAGAYEAERGRQFEAGNQAVSLQGAQLGLRQQQFNEQGALAAAGRDEFQYAQLQINEMMDRFNFEQYAPYEALSQFQQYIQSGSQFSTTKNTSKLGVIDYIGMAGSALMPMPS